MHYKWEINKFKLNFVIQIRLIQPKVATLQWVNKVIVSFYKFKMYEYKRQLSANI